MWAIYTNQKANPEGGRLSIRDISLLSKRERSQVELEVNPHAFMEALLNQIKHISRQHGRAKKISQARTREDLNDKLQRALETEKQLLHRIDNEEWTLESYAELTLHQEEVEAIRSQLRVTEERINEGAYIRTGYDWKCESEAPTGIFLKQEQWRGDQRYIGVLELEGAPNRAPTVIRTQQEAERAIVDFYGTLYKERPTASSTDNIKEYLEGVRHPKFRV